MYIYIYTLFKYTLSHQQPPRNPWFSHAWTKTSGLGAKHRQLTHPTLSCRCKLPTAMNCPSQCQRNMESNSDTRISDSDTDVFHLSASRFQERTWRDTIKSSWNIWVCLKMRRKVPKITNSVSRIMINYHNYVYPVFRPIQLFLKNSNLWMQQCPLASNRSGSLGPPKWGFVRSHTTSMAYPPKLGNQCQPIGRLAGNSAK